MDTQYQIFAKNLKYLRKKNDLTQYELRGEFNVSSVTWVKYEKGLTPPLQLLLEVSTFFNISVEDLLFKDMQEMEDSEKISGKEKIYPKQKNGNSLFLSQANISLSEEKIILRHLVWEVKKMREDIVMLTKLVTEQKGSEKLKSTHE